jgi:hypothetical protein
MFVINTVASDDLCAAVEHELSKTATDPDAVLLGLHLLNTEKKGGRYLLTTALNTIKTLCLAAVEWGLLLLLSVPS